jgi:hypothetical protein
MYAGGALSVGMVGWEEKQAAAVYKSAPATQVREASGPSWHLVDMGWLAWYGRILPNRVPVALTMLFLDMADLKTGTVPG